MERQSSFHHLLRVAAQDLVRVESAVDAVRDHVLARLEVQLRAIEVDVDFVRPGVGVAPRSLSGVTDVVMAGQTYVRAKSLACNGFE
jgi:hypothetical protein